MANNRKIRIGPVALTTTLTTNIINTGTGARSTPPVGFTDPVNFLLLRHVRISNKTVSAATFSLWIGATGGNVAGTEFMGTAVSVPANSYVDWYGEVRLDSADFLVGGAGTATALTLVAEGEIGCAG